MNKLMIAFAATMSLATLGGCKKKAGADSTAALAKTAEFKEAMCKCTDAPCAQKVDEEMTKWTQDANKSTKGPVQLSEADQKKFTELGQQMGECKQKAIGAAAAGSGNTAGSAAGSATTPAAGSGSAAGSAAGSGAAGSGSAAAGSAAAGSAAGSAAAGSAAAGSAAAGSAAAGSAAGSAAAGSAAKK